MSKEFQNLIGKFNKHFLFHLLLLTGQRCNREQTRTPWTVCDSSHTIAMILNFTSCGLHHLVQFQVRVLERLACEDCGLFQLTGTSTGLEVEAEEVEEVLCVTVSWELCSSSKRRPITGVYQGEDVHQRWARKGAVWSLQKLRGGSFLQNPSMSTSKSLRSAQLAVFGPAVPFHRLLLQNTIWEIPNTQIPNSSGVHWFELSPAVQMCILYFPT